jgi:hypothetical protein
MQRQPTQSIATYLMMGSDHSHDDDGRVIRFRPRMGTSPRRHWAKAGAGRDYSPVPDLAKYECVESDDEYRHRMIVNAAALVFTSLLILAGVWLANNMHA